MAFTKENAVEWGKKAAIARWHTPKPQIEPESDLPQNNGKAVALPEPDANDEYKERRLNRVRVQLKKLDSLFNDEVDPTKLDKLCSAMARLSEIERQLAGRPMPGSLRPKQPSTKDAKPKVE